MSVWVSGGLSGRISSLQHGLSVRPLHTATPLGVHLVHAFFFSFPGPARSLFPQSFSPRSRSSSLSCFLCSSIGVALVPREPSCSFRFHLLHFTHALAIVQIAALGLALSPSPPSHPHRIHPLVGCSLSCVASVLVPVAPRPAGGRPLVHYVLARSATHGLVRWPQAATAISLFPSLSLPRSVFVGLRASALAPLNTTFIFVRSCAQFASYSA